MLTVILFASDFQPVWADWELLRANRWAENNLGSPGLLRSSLPRHCNLIAECTTNPWDTSRCLIRKEKSSPDNKSCSHCQMRYSQSGKYIPFLFPYFFSFLVAVLTWGFQRKSECQHFRRDGVITNIIPFRQIEDIGVQRLLKTKILYKRSPKICYKML